MKKLLFSIAFWMISIYSLAQSIDYKDSNSMRLLKVDSLEEIWIIKICDYGENEFRIFKKIAIYYNKDKIRNNDDNGNNDYYDDEDNFQIQGPCSTVIPTDNMGYVAKIRDIPGARALTNKFKNAKVVFVGGIAYIVTPYIYNEGR